MKRVFKCLLTSLSTLVSFKMLCIIILHNFHFGLCRLIEQTKAHFSSRFKFLRTNLNSYEANWIFELGLALDFSLHFGFPNYEHFELFCFGLNQLTPSNWCHVILASIYHFWILDPHLKAMGPIYGSQPIVLFYFIGPWTLDPHLRWP